MKFVYGEVKKVFFSYIGAPTDGSAWEPETGSDCIKHGDGWEGIPEHCRSVFRFGGIPHNRYYVIGFRVVAVP